MTALVWDQMNERRFELGIDRGVIYPLDQAGVAWNGLVSVSESGQKELKKYYQDGLLVLQRLVQGAYEAKIEAFTYPDILDYLTGTVEDAPGVRIHDQNVSNWFHLCYRTRVGNAVEGPDFAYKLHLIYNLVIKPEDADYKTLGENVDPNTFSWVVGAMQKSTRNGQPVDHISIDSRRVDAGWLNALENELYGTPSTDPHMRNPITLLDSI